jgi:hypothetical protein
MSLPRCPSPSSKTATTTTTAAATATKMILVSTCLYYSFFVKKDG